MFRHFRRQGYPALRFRLSRRYNSCPHVCRRTKDNLYSISDNIDFLNQSVDQPLPILLFLRVIEGQRKQKLLAIVECEFDSLLAFQLKQLNAEFFFVFPKARYHIDNGFI